MSYDPASLQPGDVLLMVGRPTLTLGGLLDAAIEWATVSPFDHAAIVGDGCIIEALWHVTQSPIDKYAGNGWAYRVEGAAPNQGLRAAAWAHTRIGRRYGVREILEDGARDILHIPLWPRVHPIRYTCSGLVAAAWRQAGVRLTWAPWPSPMDLAESPVLLGPRPWRGVA